MILVLRPVVAVSLFLAFVVVLLVTGSVWFGCIGVMVGFQSRHCIGNAWMLYCLIGMDVFNIFDSGVGTE